MGLAATKGAPEHFRSGWWNYCRSCNGRYFVPNRDINAPKATRWTDDTLTKRHECAPFFTPDAVMPLQGNGGR